MPACPSLPPPRLLGAQRDRLLCSPVTQPHEGPSSLPRWQRVTGPARTSICHMSTHITPKSCLHPSTLLAPCLQLGASRAQDKETQHVGSVTGVFVWLVSRHVILFILFVLFFSGSNQSELCYFEVFQRQTAQEPVIVEGRASLAAVYVCVCVCVACEKPCV